MDADAPLGDDTPMSAPRAMWTALIEHRFAYLALWDGLSWTIAVWLATWTRYEFELQHVEAPDVWRACLLVATVQVIAGTWQGLYLGRWRLGSFEEIAALLKSVCLSALVLILATTFLFHSPTRWVPTSVPIAALFVALVSMAAVRYAWRLLIERKRVPCGEHVARVLVFGAGEGAEQVVTAMLRDPASPYLPVALLDDDPRKRQLRVRGVAVRGTRRDMATVAEATGAEVLLIAVPSAEGVLVRELARLADEAGLRVMAVPAVSDLFDHRVGLDDIRPVTTEDLLGRREIDTDIGAIANYLTGKRVLVTGAGGSIGSELCRQVHRFDPAELVMLDRDESGLHSVQLSIEGHGLLDSPSLVIADIRDGARIAEVFEQHRPEVVFHAAALKHLPLCELHPEEAMKTNVLGTSVLLERALEHGVTTFVNISTDKAADPTSVLGATKRLAERLTASAATHASGSFVSVRFGNVLGSRGSVLGTFQAQVEMGGPVTVTHEDVTRYFMTVEEAVQLVIQAGAIGENGGAMVLDMGEPVRIEDIARRLVAQSDRQIKIVHTGLRPGEKLHEVLHSQQENPRASDHPLIAYVDVEPLALDELADLQVTDALRLLSLVRRPADPPVSTV